VLKITWDQGFKRAYAKTVKNDDHLKTKFWKAMALFSSNPFDNRLRAHKLTGKLRGLWAFRSIIEHV